MSPRPQLSLCVPVCSDKDLIQEFVENTSQFFQKFPLAYEVLFAVAPDQDQSLTLLEYLADRTPHYHLIKTQKGTNRAQNLETLFKEARGDILVVTDLDLAVPLSEVFKMLEVFYSSSETEVVFGDRSKSKKKLEATQDFSHDPLEKFFAGVIKDKAPWPFQDPFCPILGIRKKSFEKIQDELHSQGWHWTPEIQRWTYKQGLKFQEVPLYVGSRKLRKPANGILAWQLFKFVLFRI